MASKAPPTKKAAQPVPETILKKRRTVQEIEAVRTARRVALQKKRVVVRTAVVKRAEQYVKEYRAQERSLIRFRRAARANGNYYVEPEAKLAVVIRIKGITNVHPKPRKVLQLLRLRQINNATFLKLNKATLNMLKVVEPYITYGYPNLKSVRELIYKRGFAKIHGQRIPIMDNMQIDQVLGKHGIQGVEDLVHEIYTVGPHFKEANSFLWPFKLNSNKGGYRNTKTGYTDGGDAGNREDQINALLRRMI
eukprot:TRINITY_DN275_c0_g1_i1.p2 TRINITY_DN275_c0_g1~~TRINITY_DN275_c0_g1_i1.p2  ORF type:complete len:250 (-),score=58.85 TRINITY_DN275_c0_g1_i1:44-793(-)